jgi:hypothetical protein
MRLNRVSTAGIGFGLATALATVAILSGAFTTQAVQNPTISLDMDTTGNVYVPSDDADADGLPDPGTNVMNVGPIDNCLTTAPPGSGVTHLHNVHLIIQNVENLVAWQVRANFIGDRMRINTVNFTPFSDPVTGQAIGFMNLPVDLNTTLHRTVTPAGGTGPAAPVDNTNTPQTHLFGDTYDGPQNSQVSGDSPYIADETTQTYDAPTGGILASVGLQVVGNEQGQQLFINLDDNSPFPPGSRAVVFNGTGTTDVNIAPGNLGDGFHGEGVTCVPQDCTTQECPPVSPSPTPGTPTPSPTPPPGFLRELDSPNPGARAFGDALAMLDSNADGAADVAVGAPATQIGGNLNRGQAYLLSGSDGAALYTFDSANPQPQGDPSSFGIATAMGDATGDGRADVLIGAQQEDVNGNNAQGRAYLFDGATGGLLFSFDTPDPGFCCANFGSAVAMGDVSGDARADVAALGGGHVYVFSGATGGLLLTAGGGELRGSIAIGDFDGDLRGDIVAGANEAVQVFSGATGALIRTIGSPNPQPGESFGNTVALGEANGDGVPDIAVSAPSRIDTMGRNTGMVFMFSGADWTHLWTFHAPNPHGGQRFGQTLAAGDASGDGRAEILIGAPGEDVPPNVDQGRVYLFSVGTNGPILTLDSPNPQASGHFGQGLAMGNVAGDGRQEAAIGARDEDVGASTDRGRVYLFDLFVPTTPTPTATATAAATPTATPQSVFTFTNATGQVASDLHLVVNQLQPVHNLQLVTNAPGCPQPSISVNRTPDVDFEFIDDVVWSSACVDPGESATFSIDCGGNCQISRLCHNWTIFGSPIGTQCSSVRPTPSPTATATPGPITPTPTVAPTATATPVTGHDARLTRISGVPKNVRLSPGEVITDNASVVVANESNHVETIGVYVDVLAPAGCTPSGRVLQTTVTLAAGAKTTIPVPVSYSCADPSAANGQSYTWTAVADHGADDLASCRPGSLQSLACFNALADDDEDPADNRKNRSGPKAIAQ